MEELRKQWDKAWTLQEEKDLSLDSRKRQRLLALINQCYPEGARVLDLGGGAGLFALELKEAGHDVLVVDCSAVALSKASSRGLQVKQYDLQKIDYEEWEPESYDVVVANYILDAVFEPLAILRLIKIVLKPGGFVPMAVSRGPQCRPNSAWPLHNPLLDRDWIPVAMSALGEPLRAERHNGGSLSLTYHGEPPKQTLALCLMMWNEEPYMRKCIESVPYDELIVGVDDATDDKTYQISREYVEKAPIGGEVYYFDHMVPESRTYNFSQRRNEGFDKAKADWIIQIDGHEYLAFDPTSDSLEDSLQWAGEVDIFHVWMHRTGQAFHLPKMWRNNGKFKYVNAVHNILSAKSEDGVSPNQRYMLKDIHCYHEWEASKAEERAKQRDKGNIPGLMEEARKNPESERPWFFIGNAHLTNHEFDDAFEAYQKTLDLTEGKPWEGVYEVRYQCKLFQAKMMLHQGKKDEARKLLLPLPGENPDRAEHYIYLADIAARNDNWHESKRWLQLATHYEMPLSPMFLEEDMYGFELYDRLSVVCFYTYEYQQSFDYLRKSVDLMDRMTYLETKKEVFSRFVQIENALAEMMEE